jgi:hypothetical protein
MRPGFRAHPFRSAEPSRAPNVDACMIRKLKSGEYRLYSRKKDSHGHHKNLGTFSSRAAAEKHEREIQGFKRRG